MARKALEASTVDNSADKGTLFSFTNALLILLAKFREDLLNIARTTLSSKVLGHGYKEHFANLAVKAVERLKGATNLDMVHYIRKVRLCLVYSFTELVQVGGSLEQSYLDDGFILEKRIGVGQPKRIENAKILLANTPMDHDKIKIFGATVQADSPEQVAAIEKAERERMQVRLLPSSSKRI